MGIFSSHHTANSSMKNGSGNYHMSGDEKDDQTSSSNHDTASSSSHSKTSSQKATCGCGYSHKAKPVDEEVLEINEEWDY